MAPPAPVVLLCGLDAALLEATAAALHDEPGAARLTYRLVVDGDLPVLSRTLVCAGEVEQTLLATSHGCLGCAIRADVAAVIEHRQAPTAPLTIVLPVGSDPACLVDPLDLAAVALAEERSDLQRDEQQLLAARLAAVVCVVDAETLPALVATDDEVGETSFAHGAFGARPVAEIVLESLAAADVVVMGDHGGDPTARVLVDHIAPQACVVLAGDHDALGAAVAATEHDPVRTDVRHEPLATPPASGTAAAGVVSQVWTTRRPLDPQRLFDALEPLAECVVRLEGPIALAGRPHELLRLSLAGGAARVECVDAWLTGAPESVWQEVSPWRRLTSGLAWDPVDGDRHTRLVALTLGGRLEAERVRELLDAVVLDDREGSAGIADEDPFTPWLGAPWPDHPSTTSTRDQGARMPTQPEMRARGEKL